MTLTLVVAAGLVALGILAWRMRTPALPPPPTPADLASLDPELQAVVGDALAAVAEDPREVARRGRLGLVYEANALHESARETFAQIVASGDDDPRWRYHLALARHRDGVLDGALADLDAVIRLDPTYAPAHRRRGQWRLESGDPDGAEVSFREALRLDPGDVAAAIGLARVHLHRDENEAAADLLGPATLAGPDRAYAGRLRATALRRLGRTSEADAARRAAGDGPPAEAPDPWADAPREHRVGYTAALERARARAGAGDLAGAIEILEALRERRDVTVEVHNNLALCYLATGRLDAARESATAAVAANDQSVQAHHLMAAVTWRRGMSLPLADREGPRRDALTHLRRALAINPAAVPTLALQGDLHAAGGERERAVASYRQAARWDPDNPEWPLQAARLLGQMRRWAEAAEVLEDAAAIHPEHGEILGRLGMVYVQLDRLDEAETCLRRAEVLVPNDPAIGGMLSEIERRRRE